MAGEKPASARVSGRLACSGLWHAVRGPLGAGPGGWPGEHPGQRDRDVRRLARNPRQRVTRGAIVREIGESAQRRGRWFVLLAVAAGLLLTACTGSGGQPAGAGRGSARPSAAVRAAAGPDIAPANGSKRVSTTAAITVTSASGPIRSVQVTAGHRQVPVSGQLSTAAGGKRATWQSTW